MRIKILMVALFALTAPMWADSAAGVSWTAPTGWKTMPERPMRAATYSVPPAQGNSEPGECGVYFFGPGQGGGVQANVDRWIGQFQEPGGKSPKDVAKTQKRTIHGLSVTTIDVSGTYTGMGGPMMASHEAKAGYRLLGAIVEAPQGAVFFKFTGPAKTVAANQAAFDRMLESVKK